MQSLTKLGVGLGLMVIVVGCTVRTGDDAKKDKFDEFMEPEPAVAALYGDLGSATPDKLRGVWRVTDNDDGEFRVRFEQGRIVSGLRCGEHTAGNEKTATVTGEKNGTVVLEDEAWISISSNGRSCGATFPAGTWSFVVDGTKATLTKPTSESKKMQLEKVGD